MNSPYNDELACLHRSVMTHMLAQVIILRAKLPQFPDQQDPGAVIHEMPTPLDAELKTDFAEICPVLAQLRV